MMAYHKTIPVKPKRTPARSGRTTLPAAFARAAKPRRGRFVRKAPPTRTPVLWVCR